MIKDSFRNDITLSSAAELICEAYMTDEDFRKATKASILSAIKDLHGSNSDEKVAEAVAERLFRWGTR